MADLRDLQARIEDLLRERPGEGTRRGGFHQFIPDQRLDALIDDLMRALDRGGREGIAAALDEVERLKTDEDPARLRQALMTVLIHHPATVEAGVRIPSLAERAPWKVRPSGRR